MDRAPTFRKRLLGTRHAQEANVAYARTLAEVPDADLDTLLELRSLHRTRVHELAHGAIDIDGCEHAEHDPVLIFLMAAADGRFPAEALREWHAQFSELPARIAKRLDVVRQSYAAWQECIQNAAVPPSVIKILRNWIIYGSARDAWLALRETAHWPTSRGVLGRRRELRPMLHPLLEAKPPAKPAQEAQAPTSAFDEAVAAAETVVEEAEAAHTEEQQTEASGGTQKGPYQIDWKPYKQKQASGLNLPWWLVYLLLVLPLRACWRANQESTENPDPAPFHHGFHYEADDPEFQRWIHDRDATRHERSPDETKRRTRGRLERPGRANAQTRDVKQEPGR